MPSEKYVFPLLIITAIGSIVDVVQFTWLLSAGWQKIKKAQYARIRAEILSELENKKEEG